MSHRQAPLGGKLFLSVVFMVWCPPCWNFRQTLILSPGSGCPRVLPGVARCCQVLPSGLALIFLEPPVYSGPRAVARAGKISTSYISHFISGIFDNLLSIPVRVLVYIYVYIRFAALRFGWCQRIVCGLSPLHF